MHKIKPNPGETKIKKIRVHVFEEMLRQIAAQTPLNFRKNKYLNRLAKLPKKKNHLGIIIASISPLDAAQALIKYDIINRAMEENILSVKPHMSSKEIITLLKYLYEKILFYPQYWKGLGGGEFKKMDFKKSFFRSQGNHICPYCNTFDDSTSLTFQIDHLFPKKHFPLLYIHEKNLIPCCIICNHKHYGKGDNWKKKYYNLFRNHMGEKIKFEFEPNLHLKGTNVISQDFLNLLKLDSRHNDPEFLDIFKGLKKKILKDIKANPTNKTFLEIQSPNYFLVKAIYEHYSSVYSSLHNLIKTC